MRVKRRIVHAVTLIAVLAPAPVLADPQPCFIEFDECDSCYDGNFKARSRSTWKLYESMRERLDKEAREYVTKRGLPDAEYELFWIANAIWISEPEICRGQDLSHTIMEGRGPRIRNDGEIRFHSDLESKPMEIMEGEFPKEDLLEIPPHLEFLGIPPRKKIEPRHDPVVVGILDSAVEFEHPALARNYRGNMPCGVVHDRNWFDATGTSPEHAEDSHGTASASLAVGAETSPNGEVEVRFGAAIDSVWIACDGIGDGPTGTVSSVLRCLQWFLAPTTVAGEDPAPFYRPDVISASIEQPTDNEGRVVFERAVEALDRAGIVFVVSAGNATTNNRCQTIKHAPQTLEKAITVGSLDKYEPGGDAGYRMSSGRGPIVTGNDCRIKPDVVAPGMGVAFERRSAGSYRTANDTSAAAPQVAGLLALWMSEHEQLRGNPARVRRFLRDRAVRVPMPIGSPFCEGRSCPPEMTPRDPCDQCTPCICETQGEQASGIYGWGYPRLDRLATEEPGNESR